MTSFLVDPLRLRDLLGPGLANRFDVDVLAECSSSNDVLLARAAQGAGTGTVVVAEVQTAGRGRRDRRWYASAESGLTFSLLWYFGQSSARLSGLSLVVGLAVSRALNAFGVADVCLKWPNDVLWDNRKLAGILVELVRERRGLGAVIGIGLNLMSPRSAGFAKDTAAALSEVLQPLPAREALLAKLLAELSQLLDEFSNQGFAVFREAWQASHAWQNQSVRVVRDGVLVAEGLCGGVDVDGALLINNSGHWVRCLSGDLSLYRS